MKAESYMGVTLWSFQGKPIGLIAVIGRKPLVNPKLAESILHLVAIRSAAELERRDAEEEIKRRADQLEAANKDLESFSYSVSHDLRAPLRAIDGYSRMILKKQGDQFDEDTKNKFNVIRGNVLMMSQLIEDLLAFSRLGKGQLSTVKIDMISLVVDVCNELQGHNPDRRIDFKIVTVPVGMGDRSLIKQVFVNILSNAIKFTRSRETAIIEVGGYEKGNEIVYYVRDNGIGFDMKYNEKMFGVFQRLHSDAEYEGTGIGLALVQRIIHRHGGRVWAEGEVGIGSTFYFTLQVM
jgi:light-regulated signal transduction histidine kinase (bacteriophytochrome)